EIVGAHARHLRGELRTVDQPFRLRVGADERGWQQHLGPKLIVGMSEALHSIIADAIGEAVDVRDATSVGPTRPISSSLLTLVSGVRRRSHAPHHSGEPPRRYTRPVETMHSGRAGKSR